MYHCVSFTVSQVLVLAKKKNSQFFLDLELLSVWITIRYLFINLPWWRTGKPGVLQSMWCKEADTTEWLNNNINLSKNRYYLEIQGKKCQNLIKQNSVENVQPEIKSVTWHIYLHLTDNLMAIFHIMIFILLPFVLCHSLFLLPLFLIACL